MACSHPPALERRTPHVPGPGAATPRPWALFPWLASCSLVAALALGPPPAASQARLGLAAPARGRLLVADEQIGDPRFAQTVILLASHDAGGSVGIVLNRPSGVPLHRIFSETPSLTELPEQLYLGGPVEIGNLLYLMRSAQTPEGALRVVGDVHISGDESLLEKQLSRAEPTEALRIFTGYAGWAPGQLEHEISRGDWHILQADHETIFAEQPDAIWKKLWKDLSGILI